MKMDPTTTEEEQECTGSGLDVEGDDQDDFGEFEEVPCEQMPQSSFGINVGVNSCAIANQKDKFQKHSSSPLEPLVFDLPLNRLLIKEADKLWEIPDDIGKEKTFFIDQTCTHDCDIFLLMDTGSKAERDVEHLDDFMDKAYYLWTQICYIDEMRALAFKWENSQTYQHFLNSLQLRKFPVARKTNQQPNINGRKYVSKQKEVIINKNTTRGDVDAQTHHPSDTAASKTSIPIVNSLMPESAHFDWHLSGLANPLKKQAVPIQASLVPNTFDFLLTNCQHLNDNDVPNSISILSNEKPVELRQTNGSISNFTTIQNNRDNEGSVSANSQLY